jgi:hypothetical protein
MWTRICPVCREELPERGNRRRYVPWKRGFRLVHAGACAEAIDAQGVLELEQRKPDVVDVVSLVRIRRLAQLLRREGEGGELLGELFPDVHRLAVALAGLDQEHAGRRPGYRTRELMRLLVQPAEVSAPARTEATA